MASDFEREEAAFRDAFGRHAEGDSTAEPVSATSGRPWASVILVAAAVLTVIGGTLAVIGRDDEKRPEPTPTSYWADRDSRWMSLRTVEVRVPAAWSAAYEAVRPDCISVGSDGSVEDGDMWSSDVPRAPYVSYGIGAGVIPAIGCRRTHAPGDPDASFGDVPFALWQPHVTLLPARPDLDQPDRQDADLRYRGWHLVRKTTHGVQVTILSSPGDDALAAAVLGSLRVVTTNHLGCPVDSQVLSQRSSNLNTGPLPDPREVVSVSVCEYQSSFRASTGLGPSRQIAGAAAQDLVRAIDEAPRGRGPEYRRSCLSRSPDRALLLLYFGSSGPSTRAMASSRVYFDNCVGNGIVGAGGEHVLTRDDCAPLFASPPIGFWFGSVGVYPLCGKVDRIGG